MPFLTFPLYSSINDSLFRIYFTVSTEKPNKIKKNLGDLNILCNIFRGDSTKWKVVKNMKQIPQYLETLFEKTLNISKFDQRDLCVKRGKLLRIIRLKIFFEDKNKFYLRKFISYFPFYNKKKSLRIKWWDKSSKKCLELYEKNMLKGFSKKLITSVQVGKIKYNQFGNPMDINQIIFNSYFNGMKKKKYLLLKTDLFETKSSRSDLVSFFYKSCISKLRNFNTLY